MKEKIQKSILLVLILLATNTAYASHIVGGEMTYECLGNNQFEITLKVYRDCSNTTGQTAGFDNPAVISVFDGNNNQVQINGTSNTVYIPITSGPTNIYSSIGNPCLTNIDVCLEEAVYITTITLPYDVAGYHVAYQRCCLNPNITNIINPSFYGTTITTFISNQGQTLCNSNPTFNNTHTPAVCSGTILSINDFTATDSDGDSLSYSFTAPYTGFQPGNPGPAPSDPPPYSTVSFIPPFSGTNPINGFPQVSIDSVTGLISGLPLQNGQYLLGIAVKEYRNGIHIGTVQKQCQINIISCNLIIDTVHTEMCLGDSIVFNSNLYDSAGIYIDTLSSSYGCDSLVILNLLINPELIHIDTALLCDGDSIVFNTNTYHSTGYYVDTLTSYTGCDSLDILLIYNSPPIILSDTIIVDDDGTLNGQISLILADTSQNYTYLWSNGATTSSISNLPASNYTVTIFNEFGCDTSYTFMVNLNLSTGKYQGIEEKIKVVPNPMKTNDFINLHVESRTNETITVSLFSTLGQTVNKINTPVNTGNNLLQIPTNNLNGLYYLTVQNEQKTFSKTILIQVKE